MAQTKATWFQSLFMVIVLASMLAAMAMMFFYAPVEAEQGVVQKIFYFHVPSAWVAFFGFLLVFVFSFNYLRTRDVKWDRRAVASAEVGLLFTSLVLITGPIWAKPVWGIWWTWDARLTLTLVLWLIYASYMLLRRYIASPEKRATLSAIVGIVGFADVPLVYFAIRWWRTQHPAPVLAGGEGAGLDPRMADTLWVSLFAFSMLFLLLMSRRAKLLKLEEDVEELRHRADTAARSPKGVVA